MRRQSEVIVRPYRKGDRAFPKGVHRHMSLTRSYDLPTEIMERPPRRPPAPLRLVRRPPPPPRPKVKATPKVKAMPKATPKVKTKLLVHHDPPSSVITPLLWGAAAILLAALIVLNV